LALVISLNATFTGNLILFSLCLALIVAAQLPLRYIFGGLKPALPLIIILAILQLIFYGGTYIPPNFAPATLFRWGPIHITTGSTQLVFVSTLRFLELLFLTSLLTNTTTTTELTHGIEDMLRPFSRLGLAGHELSLVATIALRFVPILALELESISKAQASRGAKVGGGGRFLEATRQITALLVPLFLNALRRAEDLVLAMETRCYLGGKGRTHLIHLRLKLADFLALALLVLFVTAMLFWRNRFLV